MRLFSVRQYGKRSTPKKLVTARLESTLIIHVQAFLKKYNIDLAKNHTKEVIKDVHKDHCV